MGIANSLKVDSRSLPIEARYLRVRAKGAS